LIIIFRYIIGKRKRSYLCGGTSIEDA